MWGTVFSTTALGYTKEAATITDLCCEVHKVPLPTINTRARHKHSARGKVGILGHPMASALGEAL